MFFNIFLLLFFEIAISGFFCRHNTVIRNGVDRKTKRGQSRMEIAPFFIRLVLFTVSSESPFYG